MRLIIIGCCFYYANCAAQGNKEVAQDNQFSNPSGRYNVVKYNKDPMLKRSSNDASTHQAKFHSIPATEDVRLFNDNFKECLMQSPVITFIFDANEVLCDGFRNVTKEAQVNLVVRSKDYTLTKFNLPTLKKTLAIIQNPDSQFTTTLFSMLEQAGVDPRKASKHGIRFVQDRLAKCGTGVMELFFYYYWSSATFRNEFVDRFFQSMASTLTTQEYFKFESLLERIHDIYQLLEEEDYSEVKIIIKRHYPVNWKSLQYWQAWYSMRPLEGDSKPKPEPTNHSSY